MEWPRSRTCKTRGRFGPPLASPELALETKLVARSQDWLSHARLPGQGPLSEVRTINYDGKVKSTLVQPAATFIHVFHYEERTAFPYLPVRIPSG